MKIISWNVNGIRSVQSKGFAETLARLDADCILLQETKAQADQIDKALEGIDGYRIYSNCAERKGYSGVTILSRQEPLQIINDIGIAEHDPQRDGVCNPVPNVLTLPLSWNHKRNPADGVTYPVRLWSIPMITVAQT